MTPAETGLARTEQQGPDVYRAICQAAKAISHDGIAKGKRNEQQGYAFRGIDDVYNALSGILAACDLCILPRMADRTQEERPTAKGGVLFYVTVRAEFDFVSARDGSKHTVTMYGEAMDSADKATNKAMSAAYKYCCLQVFCIPTEGMEDADKTTPDPAPKTATAAPKPAQKTMEQTLRDSITVAGENWLKKFIAKGQPQEFKRVLGLHGYSGLAEIPADHAKAKLVFDDLKTALTDLK